MNERTIIGFNPDEDGTFEEGKTMQDLRLLLFEVTDAIVENRKPVDFARLKDLKTLFEYIVAEKNTPESKLHTLFPNKDTLEEVMYLIEKRIQNTDDVTDLPRREQQTEILRDAIVRIQNKTKDYIEMSKGIAFITFDVRGLKMINDVTKDHKKGDQYLQQIASHLKETIIPFIKNIIGENGNAYPGRDGGDEMSIVIEAKIDLTKPMSKAEFDKMAHLAAGDFSIKESQENDQKPLLEWINTYIEYSYKNKENTIVERDLLEEFAKQGEDEGYELPEEFRLKLHVASGATTLHDVIDQPDTRDFKEDLDALLHSEEKKESVIDPKLPASQKTKIATSKLLGAMRTRADRQSYEHKTQQNNAWISSENEIDQVMIKIISRNDITISLAKLAQKERRRANESEGKLQDTASKLNNCLTEKARLEVSQA